MDILRIEFSPQPVEETDEEKPGMLLDYDQEGNIVGIEILDASKRIDNPGFIEYRVNLPEAS